MDNNALSSSQLQCLPVHSEKKYPFIFSVNHVVKKGGHSDILA